MLIKKRKYKKYRKLRGNSLRGFGASGLLLPYGDFHYVLKVAKKKRELQGGQVWIYFNIELEIIIAA